MNTRWNGCMHIYLHTCYSFVPRENIFATWVSGRILASVLRRRRWSVWKPSHNFGRMWRMDSRWLVVAWLWNRPCFFCFCSFELEATLVEASEKLSGKNGADYRLMRAMDGSGILPIWVGEKMVGTWDEDLIVERRFRLSFRNALVQKAQTRSSQNEREVNYFLQSLKPLGPVVSSPLEGKLPTHFVLWIVVNERFETPLPKTINTCFQHESGWELWKIYMENSSPEIRSSTCFHNKSVITAVIYDKWCRAFHNSHW